MVRGFGSFGDSNCGPGQVANPGIPFVPPCIDCSAISVIPGLPQSVIDACNQISGVAQSAGGGAPPAPPPAPSATPTTQPAYVQRPAFSAARPASLSKLTTKARAAQLAADLAAKRARDAQLAADEAARLAKENQASQNADVTGGGSGFGKYGLYAAAALAVGGIIWFATKKRQS